MIIWRIGVEGLYKADDISGEGAAFKGARWNSKGTRVIYCSGGVALAMLETMVHFGTTMADRFPMNRYLVEIAIPDDVFARRQIADHSALPLVWKAAPAPKATQKYGDAWAVSKASAVLQIPSVILPDAAPDRNFLINPLHPDSATITARCVERVIYDPRVSMAPDP